MPGGGTQMGSATLPSLPTTARNIAQATCTFSQFIWRNLLFTLAPYQFVILPVGILCQGEIFLIAEYNGLAGVLVLQLVDQALGARQPAHLALLCQPVSTRPPVAPAAQFLLDWSWRSWTRQSPAPACLWRSLDSCPASGAPSAPTPGWPPACNGPH